MAEETQFVLRSQDETPLLKIPLSAVFSPENDQNTYVWVVNPDTMTLSRRQVTTDTITPSGILVTKGLKQGEWVVTAGVSFLQEGQTGGGFFEETNMKRSER